MRTPLITLMLCLSLASLSVGAQERPKLALADVPKIGSLLRDLPKTQVLEMVNSGTVAPSYRAEIKGINYVIAVSPGSNDVLSVSTESAGFKTPEGFSITNTIGDVLAKHPEGKRKEIGWGSYVALPSGWCGFEAIDGAHDPKAKIQFFFRRERDAKKP